MGKEKKFLIYKIYYKDEGLVYVGRTTQNLQDRIRSHVFGHKMMRKLDIDKIIRIEYSEVQTCADMYLYEIYYINLFHPKLNKDDKAKDNLTVSLNRLNFSPWTSHLWNKWRNEIHNALSKNKKIEFERNIILENNRNKKRELSQKYKNGDISSDEYFKGCDNLNKELAVFDYNNGLLSFEKYKEEMGFYESRETD